MFLTPSQRNPSALPRCDLPEIHISVNPEGEDVGDGAARAAPQDEDSDSLAGFQTEANGQQIGCQRHEPKLAKQSHCDAPGSPEV